MLEFTQSFNTAIAVILTLLYLYQGFYLVVGLLLRSGEKIGDVAVAVGYENSPHFSRAFKKFYGVSPKQYQSSGQDST